MTYISQFPHFAGVQLPPAGLPDDFEDCSWGNDACPRFWSEQRRLCVWMEHPDPTERDEPGRPQFVLNRTDADAYSDEPEDVLYEGDDWGAVLAAIAGEPSAAAE